MTKVSPVTKLAILVGVVAIPYLLWTSSGTPTGVAGVPKDRAAQAADPGPADEAVPKRRELPALQTFAAVVERPLFTPTRRLVRPVEAPATEPEPPPAAAEESAPDAPPATPRPDLRFFGTMRHGKTFAALVTRAGGTGSQTLSVGDTVDDWQVAEVDRDRLVLAHEGERYTLSIFAKGEGGPPKPPKAAAPAAGGGEPATAGDAEGDQIPPDESATGDNNQGDTEQGGDQGDQGGQ